MTIDLARVLAAYLLGAVPFSQIVAAWLKPGTDLRTVGTGTVSGTGLYRIAGFGPLVVGGGLDVAKGALAASLAGGDTGLGVLIAAAVVVGHCWSVFLRGAGGRGLSPALGALAVLAWPGALVLLLGLAIGRLARQTGLGVLVADLTLILVLATTRGPAGLDLSLAVVAPMLLKRLRGNRPPARGIRTYAWRLLYDADPPSPPQSGGIDVGLLQRMVRLVEARFDQHREELNRLNVYPVPDGDTGDNLLSTLRTVREVLSGTSQGHVPASTSWQELTEGIARGALLGGRGSSGVILGQALVGFLEALREGSGATELAAALGGAATSARTAVADPVEGTILTVARDAASRAGEVAGQGGTLADVVTAASVEARRSLARTPHLLAPLARAGVVDAGGYGYVLFLDALTESLTGEQGEPVELSATIATGREAASQQSQTRFEVLCLLEANADRINDLRQRWLPLGNTVAITGREQTWRCHVHTDDVAQALEVAEEVGTVLDVEITDLAHQVVERGLRDGTATRDGMSIVAVAEGEGLVAAYVEAGADRVVVGGASSKPSTGELLGVIDGCQQPVLLLSGDKDVVPAATHAVELSTVPAFLLPVDMVAGLMALQRAGRTLDGDPATEAARLARECRSIQTLTVQQAIREAETDVGTVHPGQWLSMSAAGVVAIGSSAEQALLSGVDAILMPSATVGLVAIDLEGNGDGEVTAQLRRAHPQVRWHVLRTNRQARAYGLAVR